MYFLYLRNALNPTFSVKHILLVNLKISVPLTSFLNLMDLILLSILLFLRKIEIPTNFKLQTIEEYAFSESKIEEIYFPESLIELREGWCDKTGNLTRIIISPSNGQFIFKEDKYLIGKSNQNGTEFDKLLFVRRDIKEISIPQNIKVIGSYSFSESNIEEISIPPSVTRICRYGFGNCKNLRKIEIPTNSNLQTIENIFPYSNIKEIYIPRSVTKICTDGFNCCTKLQIIEISEESQIQSISMSSFNMCQSHMLIMIPSSLKELIKSIGENQTATTKKKI